MNSVQPLKTYDADGIVRYVWRFLRKGDFAIPVVPIGCSSAFSSISVEGTSVDNTTRITFLGSTDERVWYPVESIKETDIIFTDQDKDYKEFCSALLSFRPDVVEAGDGSSFHVTVIFKK